MDTRNVNSSNALSGDDLDALNAQLDATDVDAAVPFQPLVLVDLAAAQREHDEQLALDIEASDRFVPAPGRVRVDCAWLLAALASRALLARVAAAAAALAVAGQAEPASSSSHSRDAAPPQQHAGPGGHSTPHLCLAPRLDDEDPARA